MSLSDSDRHTLKRTVEIINRETAAVGDTFAVKGFGTFKRARREGREAHNPANPSQKITVPAKVVLTFKASPGTRVEAD
jgi:nucleoid DNA-binding protein